MLLPSSRDSWRRSMKEQDEGTQRSEENEHVCEDDGDLRSDQSHMIGGEENKKKTLEGMREESRTVSFNVSGVFWSGKKQKHIFFKKNFKTDIIFQIWVHMRA